MSWLEKLFGLSESQEENEDLKADQLEPNQFEKDVLWYHGETVNDIVSNISSSKSVTIEDATKAIYRTINEGKIILLDPSLPQSFVTYFTSIYSVWFWASTGLIGLVLASIYILPQTYPTIYLRYFASALFILYLPGYVLIEALYPKVVELEKLERFALNIGLSLASVPLVGLVLNYTPWGIRLDPVIASLSGLSIILGVVGAWRKYSTFKLSRTKS